MKLLVGSLCMALFLCTLTPTFAQEKSPIKFGKISPEDFDLSKYNFDTSVNAVVISDVGSSAFEGNSKGWFTLVYKHQKRIKILNKNGFEAASVEIPLYSDGSDEEKLADLKAYTYNVENGNIVKTELEGSAVFKDKLSKNLVTKKFTFPAVKEGSVIEYSYTVNSDFLFNLQPWEFQGLYPRIWSEYKVRQPEFFVYLTLSQGYESFFINERTPHNEQYSVTIPGGVSSDEHFTLKGTANDYRWVMKDVPALKQEGFTSSLANHIAKIEFQLRQYNFPDMPVRDIMGSWKTVSEKMLERSDFGIPINKDNNWLDADIKLIVLDAANDLDKAKHIYTYVRDNFTCTDRSDQYLNNSLKTIFKNKNGSVSDINLLLIAMLRHEHIQADPVILSTREHGFASEIYPLMSRFNYLIASVNINGVALYLDASNSLLGFGKLPPECYNGYGRKIAKEPLLVNLQADSLLEAKVTSVYIYKNDKGVAEGTFKTVPGYCESLSIRVKIKDKGEVDFFKKVSADYHSMIDISQPGIDSLKMPEQPIVIHYNFKINSFDEDIVYFNPMMTEGFKNNFFKAAERKYPVEMPYTFDEIYILSMEIPKNYMVDELPKSTKVSFNEGEGSFEYLFSKSDNKILFRSRVVMKKANFLPEDYNYLRDFFGYIVKKHSEQIVFKKKK
ncbi:MAG: DUF3857 and transglutaminase domain-containing protein [Ferruginibacter sp.]